MNCFSQNQNFQSASVGREMQIRYFDRVPIALLTKLIHSLEMTNLGSLLFYFVSFCFSFCSFSFLCIFVFLFSLCVCCEWHMQSEVGKDETHRIRFVYKDSEIFIGENFIRFVGFTRIHNGSGFFDKRFFWVFSSSVPFN